jgi:uncharacterized protein YdeI (YjbR/CyaY-like superfamily)
MAPVVPDPARIRDFPDQASFEDWLSRNHASETELWLKIHKKGSGRPTVTYAQALDVALCWGWIDGLKKTFDESSFLQRFTPRKSKSIWSQINRDHVARLIDAGRMTPHGLVHVEAAKTDGRWDKAYASASRMEVPEDLLAAIKAEPKALETFEKLNAQNRYALAFRTLGMKTEAGRAKKIAGFVEMLARGESIYPNGTPAKEAEP